jgi:hypothetical protein
MSMNRLVISIIFVCLSAGCSTNRYVVTEGTYSAWKGEQMYLRKKTILVDTKTGDTWGLAFDKDNKEYTRDGYGWERMPITDRNPIKSP